MYNKIKYNKNPLHRSNINVKNNKHPIPKQRNLGKNVIKNTRIGIFRPIKISPNNPTISPHSRLWSHNVILKPKY
jgi:hypothetical protein